MQCAACQRENRNDARFCDGCGTALEPVCGACGRELRAGARFCDACGRSQEAGSDPAPARPDRAPLRAPEAEHRQLTVMFCDLVDSTALSARLDPEDLREVVRAYQESAEEVVQRFGGHVAQYLGDGLLVYFGYPQAHEDASYRGVRTGLEIVDAMRRLNDRIGSTTGIRIAMRLAIHTGPVVIGEMGRDDRHGRLALGEVPNVAARLQELAEPGAVVISAATARLVEGRFRVEELGAFVLKGVEEPVAAWRVVGLAEPGVDAVLEDDPPSFLVGREEEVGLLARRWEQCREGLGQVVLVGGEAGIGKSSLVDSIRRHVRHGGDERLTLRCSAHHQNSPLHPISEHIHRILGFARDDTPESRLDRLERMLEGYLFSGDETVCLLAALLSIPLPEGRYPSIELSPAQQRWRLHEALAALLVEETQRHPVLLVMEDVHWADPSTLEVMGILVEQVPTLRMLIVMTFRPEFVPPWPMRSHVAPLVLNRLPREQVKEIVSHLTGGKRLPEAVIEHLISKTDGVPLFVEELTKMLLESNVLTAEGDCYELKGPLSELTIPSTLQDSLMARLDRQPGVREVAQLGAVVGREFSYEVLCALTAVGDEVLQSRLARLVEAELVYQRGRPPQSTYLFKHALIQDAAYASLLRRTRQQVHGRIAEFLEKRHPEIPETQPELVAHHYGNAGEPERALDYWYRAGRSAAQRSANAEAVAHLTQGLEALSDLPDGPDRVHRELDLQMALASSFTAMLGHGAPEVEHTYAKARELCQRAGDAPRLFRVLAGICANYIARGPTSTAQKLANELLPLAQQQEDPRLLLTAHANLGATSFMVGEFTAAANHLEQGIALAEAQPREGRPAQDQGVICYSWAALNEFVLGHPDRSLEMNRAALGLARSLDNRYSLAFALAFASFLHTFRRDAEAARACAEEGMAVSRDEFALWWAGAKLFHGWSLAELGSARDGLDEVRIGFEAWLSTGAQVLRPHFLALLAELHVKSGEIEEGLRLLDEAFTMQQKLGEQYYEAELHRLRGELQPVEDARQDAGRKQACFRRALEVSRRQGARLWELRAATSLARLWQRDGLERDACTLLTEALDGFTEGLDIRDVREARELLAELR